MLHPSMRAYAPGRQLTFIMFQTNYFSGAWKRTIFLHKQVVNITIGIEIYKTQAGGLNLDNLVLTSDSVPKPFGLILF